MKRTLRAGTISLRQRWGSGLLLLRTRHFTLEHDILRRFLRLTRTTTAFASAEDVKSAYGAVLEKIEALDRANYVILTDMRQGPKTTPGSDVEKAMAPQAMLLAEGWQRAALLMATPVGMLQATRVQKTVQFSVSVFNDEEAALEYLLHDRA